MLFLVPLRGDKGVCGCVWGGAQVLEPPRPGLESGLQFTFSFPVTLSVPFLVSSPVKWGRTKIPAPRSQPELSRRGRQPKDKSLISALSSERELGMEDVCGVRPALGHRAPSCFLLRFQKAPWSQRREPVLPARDRDSEVGHPLWRGEAGR